VFTSKRSKQAENERKRLKILEPHLRHASHNNGEKHRGVGGSIFGMSCLGKGMEQNDYYNTSGTKISCKRNKFE